MSVQIQISILVFMMVQAVVFGIGVVLMLATPLKDMAMTLFPWVIVAASVVSLPVSWWIAPRLRARYWRERGVGADVISGPADASREPI